MCSVQEEDVDIPVKKSEIKSKACMKCGSDAVLVTRINDPLCKECFMVYTTHKFRAAIGKSKLIRDGETVLVGFSGGQASSCLLQLIKDGLSERAHKKLRFKPSLLFIDEGSVINMSADERLTSCQRVLQIMSKTGFPCYIRALDEAMDLSSDTSQSADTDVSSINNEVQSDTPQGAINGGDFKQRCKKYEEAETKLKDLLKSVKSVPAKEDLIRLLRYNILIDTARKHQHTKVMMGDCSTRLSVRLLSDIAQGRGAHVAMETAFADKRLDDIMVVRPIRDFSSKDVVLYNVLNDVETFFIPSLTTKAPENTSIEQLTEKFVTGLQADYGSTVSNIMRTGEKLTTEKLDSSDKHCVICQGPLDTTTGKASALHAVEFSEEISRKKIEKVLSECCGEGDGSCNSTSDRLSKPEVLSTLCYGCRLMVKDVADINKLPEDILNGVSIRVNRSKMKAEIQEFLLEDS